MKSTLMASLDSNLIIDMEDGYRALSVMKLQARTAKDLFDIKKLIEQSIKNNGGKYPYKYITIDNASRLDEAVVPYANHLYRKTALGAGWGKKRLQNGTMVDDPEADVRTVPRGGGWKYYRDALEYIIKMFIPLCETVILICHVKDSQITREGKEISELQMDLAGKSGDIIGGLADALALLYRENNSTYLSFQGGDNTVKEARCLHLKGKKFEVIRSDNQGHMRIDTSRVFPSDEELEKLTKEALALQSAPLSEETESGKE